jgi:hypothetical protein
MGNYQEKDKYKKFYDSLEKLMVPLEYLARKCYNLKQYFLYNSERYQKIYSNSNKKDLVEKIIKSYKDFVKNLNDILKSSEFQIIDLFTSFEIKCYLQNILLWKQCCPNYRNIYDKVEKLFILIQNYYLEFIKNTDKSFQDNELSNDINDEEECKNNNYKNDKPIFNENYQGQEQQQILINKQKVIQAQELALLNDNFGRALASLECFANRYSGQKLSNVFGYYDMFNLGANQDLGELRKKAFLQTQIFRLAYEDYIRKYNSYDVPENIDIEEIKNLLKIWIQNVPNEYNIIYQGMLNTLCALDNNTFDIQFLNYAEQAKNAKMDPKKIASFAPCVYYYNQQRSEEAKNQYLEEGKISSTLNINKTFKDDKNAVRMEQQISINNNLIAEEEELKDIK